MSYSTQPRGAREPKLQGLSKRRLYAAITAGLVAAVAGGAAIRLTTATSSGGAAEPDAIAVVPADAAPAGADGVDNALVPVTDEAATPFQTGPFVKASTPLRLADPAILRSTSPQARVETVAAGRPDPFASVVLPGPRTPRANPAATLLTPAPPTPGQPLPAVPVAATQPLPPVPGVVQPVALPMLPAPFLPGSAPPSPTDVAVAPTGAPPLQSLVDQVVISGVVQVGSGVSVIVTEPGSAVSRRVAQGDLLAGGRIKLKSVDMSGPEPVLVMTYDGRDYTRTVGAPMVSAL